MTYHENEHVGLEEKSTQNARKSSSHRKFKGVSQDLTETFTKYLNLHKIPLKDIYHDPSAILQRLNHHFSYENNFQSLASYLKSLQLDLGQHYRSYLLAINDFVQSRDCSFDNRYYSKSYFFNDIQITRKGKKLIEFDTQIKRLIAASPVPTVRASDGYFSIEGAIKLLTFGFMVVGYDLSSKVENHSSSLTPINPTWMVPVFLSVIPMIGAIEVNNNPSADDVIQTEIKAYPGSSMSGLELTESFSAPHSKGASQNRNWKKTNEPDPLHSWLSLFFPPDEVFQYMPSLVFKTDDDFEYMAWRRISGSPQARKDIAHHIAQIKNFYPLQVQEFIGTLLKSMPNLQIEPAPLQILIRDSSADARYNSMQKKIQIAYPINDEQTAMSYFVHESSHVGDHFTHIVLSGNENSMSVQPFFPDTPKEQARYRRLWKKGDDRLQKMFPLINRLLTLENRHLHNSKELQEIQQLRAELPPFISKGIDSPLKYVADFDAPVEALEPLKAKGIKLAVGKIVNLDGIVGFDRVLQVNGKIRILEYHPQPDGSAQFTFEILNNFIGILRHYFNINDLLSKFPADRQDTEKLAYVRMYLPGNIVEMLWPEVHGYLSKQQARVRKKISNYPEFQIDTASIQRSSRIADQLQKLLSSSETVPLTVDHDWISLYYGLFLIEANRGDEAEKVLLDLITRKIFVAECQEGLGQIYFLRGDFEKSVHYFTLAKPPDDISRYCYSESLLELGRYKEARESFDSMLSKIDQDSHYSWIQQIIPKRIQKALELENLEPKPEGDENGHESSLHLSPH